MSDWLIRTPHGWAEPMPGPCACREPRRVIGWVSCLCGGGPLTGGRQAGRGSERLRRESWPTPGMTKPQAALWRALYAADAARLQVRQIHIRYPVAGCS